MMMRKLIDIINESNGDSQLPLDDIAHKYLGPNTGWKDTHFMNVVDQVTPQSERIKLAIRLDGGEPGDTVSTILNDNLDSYWPALSDETYAILGFNSVGEAIPPATEEYCESLAVAILDSANFGFEDPTSDTYSSYFYIIDCDQKTGMILTPSPENMFTGWYIGNPANPSVANQWLKTFRAKYVQSHPKN